MVKIGRTQPAPASLAVEKAKVNGSYNQPDVVERLRSDFKDKCYLCEMKNLTDPEVEHLEPHENGRYIDLKFDWNNLYWACRHCNSVKNAEIYKGNILDCCRVEPETHLTHSFINDHVSVIANDNDNKSVMTAKLIESCYEQRNTGIRTAACDARIQQLSKVMNSLYKNLEKYKRTNDLFSKRLVIAALDRSSGFAGFTRSYVRDKLNTYSEFSEYISL